MTYEEYLEFLKKDMAIRYLNGNVNEEEISPLLRVNEFEIWGVTMTPDLSDAYFTIYLDGMLKDGMLNENPIICRVSIKEPKYLDNQGQPKVRLTKEQKKILIDFVRQNRGNILWQMYCSADNVEIKLDLNDIFLNWRFPDYSSLETSD